MLVPGSANPLLLAGSAAATGYQVSRSVRLNSADSAYFSRTPSSAGNRRTWTLSCWVKRSALGSSSYVIFSNHNTTASNGHAELFFSSDAIEYSATDNNAAYTSRLVTTQVFRDPAAWYHIVLAHDSTQATAANRIRLYVNGVEVTVFSTATYPSLNYDGPINRNTPTELGSLGYTGGGFYFSGYLADVIFIDSQALNPSSFGEFDATTGVWNPKAYTGTYGTNGFRLPFSNNASTTTISQDSSGNNNHWTANNISVTAGAGNDSLVDSPTNYGTDTGVGGEVRGNYCTLNPLDSVTQTLANGNLDLTNTSTSWATTKATIGVGSGKWYWEVAINNLSTAINAARGMVGIATSGATRTSYLGSDAGGFGYYNSSGQKVNSNSFQSYGASFANGDIIGVALDCDAGTITFYKNGASQGQAYTGLTSGPYFPAASLVTDQSGGTPSVTFNFGQRPFAYAAPSSFKALCTANLPTPTIANPATVFDTKLWSGNSGTQNITGCAFSPDLAWVKGRVGTLNHVLSDTVRGANLKLASNTTSAEDTTTDGTISSFNSDGITVAMGTGTYAGYETNLSGYSYVGWFWDAGSSTVTNTQGSITSQVRANASAGFSIVTYSQGANNSTVGHGLGAAPHMIIAKSRTVAGARWDVFHRSLGRETYMYLDGTNAAATYPDYWGTALPTSTTFSVSLAGNYNNTGNMVAYCFAPVSGFSAFGSYTGNGSADGPMVFCNFRPRWILIKSSSVAGESWFVLDTSRSPYNVSQEYLMPNSSASETSAYTIMDILSNGFKLKTSGGGSAFNGNGATYIYAAFAESPFAYARAR